MNYHTATTAERAADFITVATTLHNGRYDYLHVADQYVNGTTPVSIICTRHGVFSQKPQDHRRGQGCPKCSLRAGTNVELRKQAFLEKARAIHGRKFDYSHVEFVGLKTHVTVVCRTHGEFSVRPDNHIATYPTGCKDCARTVTENAERMKDGKWVQRRTPLRRRASKSTTSA